MYRQGKIRVCKLRYSILEWFFKRLVVAPGSHFGEVRGCCQCYICCHIYTFNLRACWQKWLWHAACLDICGALHSHTGQKVWCLCRMLTWVTIHITWKCIRNTSSGKQTRCIVRVMMSLHVFPTRFINKAYAERKKGCCRPCCSKLEVYTITCTVLTMQTTVKGTLKCLGVLCASKHLSLASAKCKKARKVLNVKRKRYFNNSTNNTNHNSACQSCFWKCVG